MKKVFIGIIVSLTLAVSVFAESAEKPQFKETVTSLGNVPDNFEAIPASVKMSPNLRHITYAAFEKTNHTRNIIRWDDRTSPVYYAIRSGFPKFSADDRHAYIAYKDKKGKASIVVDWELDGKFDNAGNFLFSPDGKRYAYHAVEGDKQSVVIDGKPDKWYTGIVMNDEDNILFSPDSQHIAYVAFDGKACKVVQDGNAHEHNFQLIKDLKFSPDSKKLAYKGRIEKKGIKEKWCVVVNGKKQSDYALIFDLVFSPDSKHLAYSAVKEKERKMALVLDGEEVDVHDRYGMPTFSPDSKKLAYSFKEDKNFYVVINSEKGPGFPMIYKFFFSPDSSRYAYIAGKERHWQCVVDDQIQSSVYEGIEAFKFSRDSSRYMYGAITDDGGKIVVDGNPHETYLSVGEPIFSPDSKHTVYRARRKKVAGWVTVFDGDRKGNYYPAIGKHFFSKDSKHLAYSAMIDFDKNIMVVDGERQCEDKKFTIIDDPYFSPDGNYVAHTAGYGKTKEFFLVVNGHVLPTTYSGFYPDTPIVFEDDNHFRIIGVRLPGPEFLLIEVEIPENIKLETDLSDL